MTWRVEIPGQPVSWNHAYHPTIVRREDGRVGARISKQGKGANYQSLVLTKTKEARPSGWHVPVGTFVRIHFWYFLNPDLDCDNVKKVVIDAIAAAIPTDDPTKMLNDRWVLTCDIAKERAEQGQQRLVLEISLEPRSDSSRSGDQHRHSIPTGTLTIPSEPATPAAQILLAPTVTDHRPIPATTAPSPHRLAGSRKARPTSSTRTG